MARTGSRFGRIVRRSLAVAAALAMIAVGAIGYLWYAAPVDTVGEVKFDQQLRIPELLEPTRGDDGQMVYSLTAQTGETVLRPGESPADTWGFNGSYLGPTLRMQRGEDVMAHVRNELDEATTVHWHGMHLPPEMDGGPHQMVEPGGMWMPWWRVDQPAGTLWYHPHPHGDTEDHVYRGLAGMILVDDPHSKVADQLPHKYGVDDVPVIVQDVELDDGQLDGAAGVFSNPGHLGDTILVNGTYGPFLDVTTELVRLRLLNASTGRVYDFGFSDDRTFRLIGTDGGLLPEPHETNRIMLSPGERADIVVQMTPGDEVELRSSGPDLGLNFFSDAFDGGEDTFDVLQLRAADRLDPSPDVPATLGASPDLVPETAAEPSRTFALSGRNINGQGMDMTRIDEVIELGTTEVWEVSNADGAYHSFHVHDVQFQVLSVDDREPPPELSGWKDTLLLRPGETLRIALRFADYADPDTPYMYHCHLLWHEDRAMMGQFVVVEPGRDAADEIDQSSGEHEHSE